MHLLFCTAVGSGSISRLFLAIKSSVLFSERAFYQPPWLFFPPLLLLLCTSCSVSEGLRRTPQNPLFSHGPFPPSPSAFLSLDGRSSWLRVRMICAITSTPVNEFTPLQLSRDVRQHSLVSAVRRVYLSSSSPCRCHGGSLDRRHCTNVRVYWQ